MYAILMFLSNVFICFFSHKLIILQIFSSFISFCVCVLYKFVYKNDKKRICTWLRQIQYFTEAKIGLRASFVCFVCVYMWRTHPFVSCLVFSPLNRWTYTKNVLVYTFVKFSLSVTFMYDIHDYSFFPFRSPDSPK